MKSAVGEKYGNEMRHAENNRGSIAYMYALHFRANIWSLVIWVYFERVHADTNKSPTTLIQHI